MKRLFLVLAFLIAIATLCLGEAGRPLLLRNPTLSRTHIAFEYAGDLWLVGREGGEASRLTSGVGTESDPHFSPDGTLLNDTLLSYRIPAFSDAPAVMTCTIVENGDGPGPFGAKGCGEGGLAAIPAAIVNAVADAGVPMNTLPLTPERVWRRIQEIRK